MENLIVTNNNLVTEKFQDCILVQGDYLDVLYKIRDLIHEGHELISHPLTASIKMMYSPVRSVLVSKEKKELHEYSLQVIEDSIDKYKVTLGERPMDIRNKEDYKIIDCDLIISAIEEIDFINSKTKI